MAVYIVRLKSCKEGVLYETKVKISDPKAIVKYYSVFKCILKSLAIYDKFRRKDLNSRSDWNSAESQKVKRGEAFIRRHSDPSEVQLI